MLIALLTVLTLTVIDFVVDGRTATGTDESSTREVKIDNFSFSPPVLTVRPGTDVRWINQDDVPHTIVSTEQKFKSDAMDTDSSFSHTFTEPGTYEYFCSLHPKMVGKVIVQEAK
jgi:plastocyanin